MGAIVINKGISIIESALGYNSILLTVDYLSISISNGIDPTAYGYIFPHAVSSARNIFFASNIVADNRITSAGGHLKNIQIQGDSFNWLLEGHTFIFC